VLYSPTTKFADNSINSRLNLANQQKRHEKANMRFNEFFSNSKPVIGCIHLMALPGAPLYGGSMRPVYEQALSEAHIFKQNGIDGLIVENFRDQPFYPRRVPVETVAALAAVARDIVRDIGLPTGINVLRNDGDAAMAIATAVQAQFIRVNVHGGAVVSEQGIIEGVGHLTTRLRSNLRSNVLILADVGVKHAAPLADRGLATETKDLTERGLVDAIIVSGERTGSETSASDVELVRINTALPVLIGSGATPDNIVKIYDKVDGFIVGSYLKSDGKGEKFVDPQRVTILMQAVKRCAEVPDSKPGGIA